MPRKPSRFNLRLEVCSPLIALIVSSSIHASGHTGAKGLLQEEGFVFKHYSNPEYQAYEKFKEHPEMQALIPAYGGRVIRTNPVTGESSRMH